MATADAAPAETPTDDACYGPEILREQLLSLRRAAAERAKAETEIAAEFEREVAAAKSEASAGVAATTEKHRSEIAASRKEYEAVLARLDSQAGAEQAKIDEQRKTRAGALERSCADQTAKIREDAEFEQASVKEVFKEKRNDPQKLQAKAEKDLARYAAQFDEVATKGREFLGKTGVKPPAAAAPAPSAAPEGDAILAELESLHADALAKAKDLFALDASKTIFGGLKKDAAQKAAELWGGIEAAVARGKALLPAAGEWVKVRTGLQSKQMEAKARQDLADLEARAKRACADLEAKRDAQLAELEEKYRTATATIRSKVQAARTEAEAKYPARIAALETGLAEDVRRREAARDERLAAAERRRSERTAAMTDGWRAARSHAAEVIDAAGRVDAAAFPAWEALAAGTAPLPDRSPPGLRFGRLDVSLSRIPGGVSNRPELNAFGPESWPQPAPVPFPAGASLVVKTTGDQREAGGTFLQALTLRIASGVPAGQTRFTIIDPLGLGKHFAGFMHLADHDELLVTSRIWTEPQQIEQRLADLTEHMELVIQKYLRNEYESIAAYNADAEVPEPYRFVVVANFPANFTETSARRLASIASSGARCGVATIVSVDTKQTLPSGFSLAELEQHATVLRLENGTFTWQDPEFSKWPLTVESPPSDEAFTEIVQRVGKAAKAAKRVEVPFDRVAPPREAWWTGSTASGVDVPLGPAGAKKMQHMKLGKGTSQHVLIAGKTGSGKSTMMHALITNLALTYSPNEVQFYLIDFKKGVEFKIYDHYKLPHARVIAIESEREFGLSVLEQLDRELKRRGDLFRDLAVQDLAGFRATGNPDPMPRVLLIIDEFQELFIEDDKLAQDASLILDRLVRQGRAFGMHVLLGSQTLGGSYSLPRATMGQMAVRIALQCNEADSSLILSEDNSAARLLTRPGEAIYNDANGMLAGNNPFQVVWLDDARREWYLGELRRLADARADIAAVPRIVFDGNQAADPAGNRQLAEVLVDGKVGGRPQPAPVAWLGEAIAIKDPTAATFRRQGGANLLIVGQREDLAVSLLGMAITGLAAGNDPFPGGALGHAARFVLFEPAVADEKPDLLLSKLAAHLPHEVENVGRLAVADAVAALAAEVKRRLDGQVLDGEAVYVVIRDLARFRELRRADGDFGFSFGSDKKAGPADNLLTVLKDGPAVGVHVLVWCDSLTNLMRTFERGTLKEFELRVLFQMSASDSSQLVDSPLASKLGPQRALFIHEETGTFEKFRPYAFPAGDWLADTSRRLRERPQGTPVDRPRAAPPADGGASAAGSAAIREGDGAAKGEFDFGFGGGDGEFNFTKFLDDPPAGPGDAATDG